MNIMKLAQTVVGRIMKLYPDADREDLVAQALYLATEKRGGWDSSKAALSTYLYQQMYDGLRKYLDRYVNKGESMRNWAENEGVSSGFVPQVEARNMIQVILESSSGNTRDVLELILEGYNTGEVSKLLGLTQRRVQQILKEVRDRHE